LNKLTINISLGEKKSLQLEVFSETSSNDIFEISEADAKENGESPYQILEGHTYEYALEEGYVLEEINGIVTQSKKWNNQGRINPGIYVGTLTLNVLEEKSRQKVSEVKLEVRSIKAAYRSDYRTMLEDITEQCTDLLLQPNSPVTQYFTADFEVDSKTLYQRFTFLKSVLDSSEFNEAVHKFLQSPITKWTETEIERDVRALKRIGSKDLRQFVAAGNRIPLPQSHHLHTSLPTIPSKIKTSFKKESIDTPENRFVRYALISFLFVCTEIRTKATSQRLATEASLLELKLEEYLSHSIFKDISYPNLLPLNSPVLQRKEGYREILRAWLMFDLAAKLVWHGGEDVYAGNKKDVAVLYEYWLFFKLLEVIKELFQLDSLSINELMEKTKDGLGLKLKQGQYLPVKGVYKAETRVLNIEFSYNRTFIGEKVYPKGGSWTKNLRPDYTLSIWPFGIEVNEAEEQELITHIHFDAKYRIEDLTSIFGTNDYLDEEKLDQAKGTFKRADLLKMHTYRDAIRRTAGAYILYPGSESTRIVGFHELLPGLGAFAIRPNKADTGIAHLKSFLKEVVNHFLNRASQREKMALKTYEVHKDKRSEELKEELPEPIGTNRNFIPDETYVLVGFYKSQSHLHWILKNNLYNVRVGHVRGSLRLGLESLNAKYLLLHSFGETKTSKLFKLSNKGPRIFSKQDMREKSYPNPRNNFYIVYDIISEAEVEFAYMNWNITKLPNYGAGRSSSIPFAVSMMNLMKVLIK
jgi:predicted component of viral defense system (DUF524 family)